MSDINPCDYVWVRSPVMDIDGHGVLRLTLTEVCMDDDTIWVSPDDVIAADISAEPCPICNRPIDTTSANPDLWPVVLPHGEPGCSAAFHAGCVHRRLATISAIAAELKRLGLVKHHARAVGLYGGPCEAQKWHEQVADLLSRLEAMTDAATD